MMCERCRRMCEAEKRVQSLKDTQKYLDMLLELREQFDRLSKALGYQPNDLVPDISMPESFDDLVSKHGKDVVRDWLKAMLK